MKTDSFLCICNSFLPLPVFCIHSRNLLLFFRFACFFFQSIFPNRACFFKFPIILFALFWTVSNWWMLLQWRTLFWSWNLMDSEPSERVMLHVIVNYTSVCTLKWYLPFLLCHYWCVELVVKNYKDPMPLKY